MNWSSLAGTWTLEACVEVALENNRSLRITQQDIAISEALLGQAKSSYWPSLSMQAVASTMDEDPVYSISVGALGTLSTKVMDKDNMVASISAEYPLYTGGRRAALTEQAQQGVVAAQEGVRRSEMEVRREVKCSYYAVVMTRALGVVAHDAVARLDATMDLSERLYQTGTGRVKKTDYLRTRSVLGLLRAVEADVEARQAKALRALQYAMGVDGGEPVIPELQQLPRAEPPAALNDFKKLVQLHNPRLAQLHAGVHAAEARLREAQGAYLPTVGLFASYQHIENSYDLGLVDPENTQMGMVGLKLQVPLFEGFRTVNKVREQQGALEKLQLQEDALLESLYVQLSVRHIDWKRAYRQVGVVEDALEAARENRALNERAYRESLVETRDVIQAQLLEALLEQRFLQADYEWVEQACDVEFLIGGELDGFD